MVPSTFITIVLSVVNWSRFVNSRAVPLYHSQQGEITVMKQVDISTDFSFLKARDLVIKDTIMTEWDESMFSKINHTKYLTFEDGTVPIMTFNSNSILSLSVINNQLSMFEVWPERNQVLQTLRLSRNIMRALSPTLRYLEGLVSLDLSQNELKSVDLQTMQNMSKLKSLDLSVNKITSIDASAGLKLNRLKILAVSFNELTKFDSFPEAFPVLDTVRLIGNQWTCEWVDSARKSIMERRIVTFGVDYGCSEHRQGGLCCYGALAPESTTKSSILKQGPLLEHLLGFLKDVSENPIKSHGDQSVLELLTHIGDARNGSILFGVQLDVVKVYF